MGSHLSVLITIGNRRNLCYNQHRARFVKSLYLEFKYSTPTLPVPSVANFVVQFAPSTVWHCPWYHLSSLPSSAELLIPRPVILFVPVTRRGHEMDEQMLEKNREQHAIKILKLKDRHSYFLKLFNLEICAYIERSPCMSSILGCVPIFFSRFPHFPSEFNEFLYVVNYYYCHYLQVWEYLVVNYKNILNFYISEKFTSPVTIFGSHCRLAENKTRSSTRVVCNPHRW